jgi:hypothetical protein
MIYKSYSLRPKNKRAVKKELAKIIFNSDIAIITTHEYGDIIKVKLYCEKQEDFNLFDKTMHDTFINDDELDEDSGTRTLVKSVSWK